MSPFPRFSSNSLPSHLPIFTFLTSSFYSLFHIFTSNSSPLFQLFTTVYIFSYFPIHFLLSFPLLHIGHYFLFPISYLPVITSHSHNSTFPPTPSSRLPHRQYSFLPGHCTAHTRTRTPPSDRQTPNGINHQRLSLSCGGGT